MIFLFCLLLTVVLFVVFFTINANISGNYEKFAGWSSWKKATVSYFKQLKKRIEKFQIRKN